MDLDLWLRLAREANFSLFTMVVARMQDHEDTKTRAHNDRTWAESIACLHKHGLDTAACNLLRRYASYQSEKRLRELSVGEAMKHIDDDVYLSHLSLNVLLRHLVRRMLRKLPHGK